VSACSRSEAERKIDELGQERVRFLSQLVDDIEKCDEYVKAVPLKKLQFERAHEFAQFPWTLQKPVIDKYGEEIERLEKRVDVLIDRLRYDQFGKEKLKLMKSVLAELEKSAPAEKKPSESVTRLAKLNEVFATFPESARQMITEKYGQDFIAQEKLIEAAANRWRPEKKN